MTFKNNSLQMKKNILTAFLFLVTYFTFAQVKLEARVSKTNIMVGETIQLDFVFNNNGQNFEPPRFGNFEVGGPFVSASENIVNGAYSASQQYSYALQATKAGVYTIQAASIVYKGKAYFSKPIQLVVSNQKRKESTANASGKTYQIPTNKTIPSKNQAVFIEAELAKKEVFINEPVEVTYRIYLHPKFRIEQENKINYPKYNNFWSQTDNVNYDDWQEVYVNGRTYYTKAFRTALLYPQKTGLLTINPITLDLNIAYPTGELDFFDDPVFDTTRKIVVSNALKINVKPLPENGKPKNFTGAVGDFDFTVVVDKNAGKTGESFEMKFIVSGSGNLKLFDLPKPIFPQNVEVFEPKHTEEIKDNVYGMTGKITDSYTLIPTKKGELRFPEQTFTFFNSQTKKYETITAQPLKMIIQQGTNTLINHANAIKKNSVVKDFSEAQSAPASGIKYLVGVALFLLASIVIFWYLKKKNNIKNQVYDSTNELVIKEEIRVETPSYQMEILDEQDTFDKEKMYQKMERILHATLSQKINFEGGFTDKTSIEKGLREANYSEEIIENTLRLLHTCEQVKYAPFLNVAVQEDFQTAQKVLSALRHKN